MAIVTNDEVKVVLGGTIAAVDEEQLSYLIDLVQAEMEVYVNRPLEPRVFTDERYVVNLLEGTLFLKHSPVVSIASVTADDEDVDSAFYAMRSWGLDFSGYLSLAAADPVIWTPAIAVPNGYLSAPDASVLARGEYPQSIWEVTYTAGFDGANDLALKSVLIRCLRREMGALREGFDSLHQSIRVEDFARTTNAGATATMRGTLSAGDLKILDRYRRWGI